MAWAAAVVRVQTLALLHMLRRQGKKILLLFAKPHISPAGLLTVASWEPLSASQIRFTYAYT